jgi:thiol-disulfide isomerase/thioredoxin
MNQPISIVALLFCVNLTLGGCNAPTETLPNIGSSGLTDNDLVSADTAAATEAKADVKIEFTNFDGLQTVVKKHEGKLVVVDVWSNSCLPCMKEFHNLVDLSTKYPEQIVCISMNVNYIGLKSKPPESSLPKVQEFLDGEKATQVLNFVSTEADSDILTKYEIDSIPAVVLYDTAGAIAATFTDSNSGEGGMSYTANVIPKIEAMLAK